MGNCSHLWSTNHGKGGAPFFGRKVENSMYVVCLKCNDLNLYTAEQWKSIQPKLKTEQPTDGMALRNQEFFEYFANNHNLILLESEMRDIQHFINRDLIAAIEVLSQTVREVRAAQNSGPGWYTKGAKGLYMQVRLWLDKADKALKSVEWFLT